MNRREMLLGTGAAAVVAALPKAEIEALVTPEVSFADAAPPIRGVAPAVFFVPYWGEDDDKPKWLSLTLSESEPRPAPPAPG